MLARCARCQNTFTTDHFGRQICPHCGSELILADPNAPAQPPAPPPQPSAAPEPPAAAPPGPPPGGGYPPPSAGGWAPLPPAPAPPPPPELPAPFAERRTRGFFASYFATWKLALLEPQKFFTHVRVDQVGSAILFAVLSIATGTLLQTLYSWAQFSSMRSMLTNLGEQEPVQRQVYEWIAAHLGAPLVLGYFAGAVLLQVVVLFVAAAAYHLLLMLFKGGGRGFEATLTAVGYSYGTSLLLAVPFCGSGVAFVWQIVAVIIGLAAIQRTTVGKSAAAVLIAIVAACCLGCCGSVFSAGFLSEIFKQPGGGAPSTDI